LNSTDPPNTTSNAEAALVDAPNKSASTKAGSITGKKSSEKSTGKGSSKDQSNSRPRVALDAVITISPRKGT
jgi:hypothetical protein